MEIQETWTDGNGRKFNLVALLKNKHKICVYEIAEKDGANIVYSLATITDDDINNPFIEKYSSKDFGGIQNIDDVLKFKNTMEYIRKMSVDVHLTSNK